MFRWPLGSAFPYDHRGFSVVVSDVLALDKSDTHKAGDGWLNSIFCQALVKKKMGLERYGLGLYVDVKARMLDLTAPLYYVYLVSLAVGYYGD